MSEQFISQEEIDALLGKKEGSAAEEKSQAAADFSRETSSVDDYQDNLEIILDFPLKISVRLGEVKKTLEELRQIAPGYVFELDRLVNDPVDLYVNGKLIARGEVVVVDESFGVRVNQILSPVERVKKLR